MEPSLLNPVYEKVIEDLLAQQYSVADDFFSADEVLPLRESLLVQYEQDTFKKSAIGNHVNEQVVASVRGDFIKWIDEAEANAAEKRFFARIDDFMEYLNRTCFMGLANREFHYAVYPEGTFYKRHLDTFQNDSRRKISVVCYLNSEDWQPDFGGELAIYKPKEGQEETITIYPLQGRVVFFESQELEHEVKPVKQQRFSITGWLKARGEVIF